MKKDYSVNKNEVLKVCNKMKIFYLGKSVKNVEYINSDQNNYLRAVIPVSLNQNDLVNCIQILEQFVVNINAEINLLYKEESFKENIHQSFRNTNRNGSSRSYQAFMNTVKNYHVSLLNMISK